MPPKMKPLRWNDGRASAGNDFARTLRKLARMVNEISGSVENPDDAASAVKSLIEYAKIIEPWANKLASDMVSRMSIRTQKEWIRYSERFGIDLRAAILSSSITSDVRLLQQETIELIQSIPKKAAKRVEDLAMEYYSGAIRAEEFARKVKEGNDISIGRANVIARTETSRAGTILTQARAVQVGSESYIWRTAEDVVVRPSHADMDGKLVYWNTPPTLDGLTGHAGALPNCRCIPMPVINGM